MTTQYKRKFLVPGDTIKTCWDYRGKCEKQFGTDEGKLPCSIQIPTVPKTYTGGHYIWSRDEKKCPFPINKPSSYIVSETVDGEWQCSCKAWTTHKPRQDCKHIIKAKANPKEYEIAVDWTSKSVETMKKVTG